MTTIERLKERIKNEAWVSNAYKNTSMVSLAINQLAIMEALVELLERAKEKGDA